MTNYTPTDILNFIKELLKDEYQPSECYNESSKRIIKFARRVYSSIDSSKFYYN